ncbi:hypothetical protein BO71DRAFT_216708 [Aspergillus ellipticus CBS 707.79]|uniref:Uncharacterized protein n=1 Tax=Aspergillus ellipticus CBS 707.79 TaxID=1448320 RepID=A0A319E2Y7_9EURO|nr:hypothetical protein BO71DRAFT_216708 [Aspergillus ellipticus CBS 707.79]
MSWAGFKKNVNRATTQVMMKTGMLLPPPFPVPRHRLPRLNRRSGIRDIPWILRADATTDANTWCRSE